MGCKSSSSRAAPVLTSNNIENNRSSRYSVPANTSNRQINEPKRKRRTRSHSRRRSNEANSIEAQDALLARALQMEEDRQLVSLLQLQLLQSVENNNNNNNNNHNRVSRGHRHHTRNEGLSTREIERFPMCGNKEECEICMDEDPDASFRMLPCMHSFHAKCVDPWLKKNRHCPHCQSDMRQVANLPEDEVMALSMRDV